jgi:hypothetical protein
MRRGFGIGFMILATVFAIAIGAGAYHVGYVHGLEANGTVQVVRTIGYGGWGFFPFGLFLFPLFLFFIFGVKRAFFWGGGHHHDGHGPMGPGGWDDRRRRLEDWHQRQHEPGPGDGGSAGGEPAGA